MPVFYKPVKGAGFVMFAALNHAREISAQSFLYAL